MAIYYIGAFPPSYGGVTVKNQNLYEALPGHLKVRRIDMNRVKRGDVREILRFGWAMVTGKQYIIGLAGQKNRRKFTKLLHRFRRRAMERSVMLVMGGLVEDMIEAGPGFLTMMNRYRRVFVETSGMKEKLEGAGAVHVGIYPNARPRPTELQTQHMGEEALKAVYFSIIQPEKGVDLILQAAQMLPELEFHFYGEIRRDYERQFRIAVDGQENVYYHGVFTANADALYRELGQYDVLLLPTGWKAEGLPGILVEAKMAQLPAVVSDHNFNREIVTHELDGLVLRERTAEALTQALSELNEDRHRLGALKRGAMSQAEKYDIARCVQEVILALERG